MANVCTFYEKDGNNHVTEYNVANCNNKTIITGVKSNYKSSSKYGESVYGAVVAWLSAVFLPQGFPHSVSPDYLHYQMWDTMQAWCSSVAGAVSLHAALGSLGVGQEGSTPLAATLTWLTNTGVGMMASIAFTYCKGTQLDSNNKQWRLFADVANDMAHLVKLAAPLLPLPAVVPLTLAALLYALVGVAGGATRTALTAHQARCNNLGDVAAKDGSQENLVNLTALITSLLLLPAITHSLALTWSVFLVLLFAHLYCNYRAVRAVVAPSLNRPRLLLILQQFREQRTVPAVAECNEREPLLSGPAFVSEYLCPGWSLSLGCSLQLALKNLTSATPYMQNNFMLLRSGRRVLVPLADAATNDDFLLACHTAYTLATMPGSDAAERTDDLSTARTKALDSFPALLRAVKAQGWKTDELYLTVGECRVLSGPQKLA